ncbi:MAG: hypothetical protein AAF745_08035 [Planctomycetota bacterium]
MRNHPRFGKHLQTQQTDRIAGWNPEWIASTDTSGWCMLLIAIANLDSVHQDAAVEQAMLRCHYRLVAILRGMGSGPLVERESEQVVVGRLITHYLMHADVDDRDRLVIATRFGCKPFARSVCRRILNDPARSASAATIALMTASAIGMPDEEINGWLARSRNDHRVSHVWRSGVADDIAYQVQVRDVAWALHLHRHGIDPRDRGFAALVADPVLVFRAYSLGFKTDAERQSSHDGWNEVSRKPHGRRNISSLLSPGG